MNVLIIEDELPAAQRLSKMIQELYPDVHILAILDSIESSIHWFSKHHAPDILFLDIHLADGSSFEIFNHITVHAPVIFTTAYHEYALKAFEVNSIDYLLKPIKKEQLQKAITKYKSFSSGSVPEQSIRELMHLLQPAPAYKTRFMVQYADKIAVIEEQHIAYFYSEEKITFLITKENKRYTLDVTLDELEKSLQPKLFFRLNRQYIARIDSILEISHHFNGKLKIKLTPSSDKELFVSRERAHKFRAWLDEQI